MAVDPNWSVEETARQAYIKAVRLLGARDHSRFELSNKLAKTGFDQETIEKTLSQLMTAGYQCDTRFAQIYTQQLIAKGRGPLFIKSKLSSRGISSELAGQALSESGSDWSEIAADALLRRFTADQLSSNETRLKAKIARFLQSRGFSGSDALRALRIATQNRA